MKPRCNDHLRGKEINIRMPREIQSWSSILRCAQDDLIRAVQKVGASAKMVDDFLILNRQKNTPNGQ